jgi:hypothetical protein|tara:strand:- start:144 stop:779 length:636 start_codon:yes stop_codon:yes gene_type:complete
MTKEITAALCKFIQQVGTIEEKDTAQYGKFADLSTVLSTVNPALAANGLAVVHTTKVEDNKNILITNLLHTSGESITSEMLLPVNTGGRGNPMHQEGGAITYCRRYSLLAILGLNAGIPDNDGDFANPTADKVTPINKNKAVGMPTILDTETKKYYLRIVGELIVKDPKLYNTLADALYIEFDFNRNKKLSENITLPKHVTFIEEWLAANK